MNYFMFKDINEGHSLSVKNFYSWRITVFDYCKGIKKYKEIVNESYKWTLNCFIYNMTLNRIKSLLNLASEKIRKCENELKKSEANFMLINISIMNAAQYLRYSIESTVSQLVNNNVKILSENVDQINETWRIKSIFNVLEKNKIDWSIKNLPIINRIGEQISMDFKRKHNFSKDLIDGYFEYLSDILHDKHILHKKYKIIHANTFEEYKRKEIDILKANINELNKIHNDIYDIMCNHSILLENGECIVIVEDFKITNAIPAKLTDYIHKY